MTLPPVAEVLDGGLGGEQQAEHVDVEHPVERFLGDGLDGGELVHPGVVDQDVEPAVGLDRRVDDALARRPPWRRRPSTATALPPLAGDVGDHLVGPGLAGRVVHHHRRAFGGELPGDLRPDALRRARHHRDLAFEFLRHDSSPVFRFKNGSNRRAAGTTARRTTPRGTPRGTTARGPRTPAPPPASGAGRRPRAGPADQGRPAGWRTGRRGLCERGHLWLLLVVG